MIDLGWEDLKMFLGPEANAAIGVAEGKDPGEVLGQYALSHGMSELSSMPGAEVSATTEQFAQNGLKSPGLQLDQTALQGPQLDPYKPAALTPPPEMAGPMPEQTVSQAFPNDTSLSNSANIKLGDNAVTSPQFDGYQGPTTSPANLPKPEEPGTFLGLEGKDYTKMGMQGVMAAGVGAMQPQPIKASTAPAGPGITKGSPIQAPAQGVNSMGQVDPRVNSMQMTQAQGLISPFQQDMRRRRGY